VEKFNKNEKQKTLFIGCNSLCLDGIWFIPISFFLMIVSRHKPHLQNGDINGGVEISSKNYKISGFREFPEIF
jgi:hypothetical protein